jgi:hypothetical protein
MFTRRTRSLVVRVLVDSGQLLISSLYLMIQRYTATKCIIFIIVHIWGNLSDGNFPVGCVLMCFVCAFFNDNIDP